jgi:hypothetical protein
MNYSDLGLFMLWTYKEEFDKTEGKNVLAINIITIRGSSNLMVMRKRR